MDRVPFVADILLQVIAVAGGIPPGNISSEQDAVPSMVSRHRPQKHPYAMALAGLSVLFAIDMIKPGLAGDEHIIFIDGVDEFLVVAQYPVVDLREIDDVG